MPTRRAARRASSSSPRAGRRGGARPPTSARPAKALVEVPAVRPGSRLWVLDEVPFGTRPAGATYSRALKAFVVEAAKLPVELEMYRAKDCTQARWVEDDLNGTFSPHVEGPAMTPRPDQLVDITTIVRAHAAGQRGFFLTSQPGTGKTLVSVRAAIQIASRRANDRPGRVLVLAGRPASLCIPDFRATIQAAGGSAALRWLVTTIDRVHRAAALGVDWDVVIVDEAHNYRDPDIRRSKALVRVTKARNSRPDRGPFVIAMSATPAHDPTEVTYLGPLLAQRTGTPVGEWVGADGRFKKALKAQGVHLLSGRYGLAWTEDAHERAADLAWMRSVLERTPAVTLYREALWGPAPLDVAAVELEPARKVQYDETWAQYIHEMGLARKVGHGDKGRAAILRWRQKALHLRVPDIATWAESQVEAGCQVVIYTDFVTMGAEPLVEALDAATIRSARLFGGHDLVSEQAAFASGAAPVAVTTMSASINLQAGAVGVDGRRATTAPRVGAMAAPIYSGIKGRQVIGRTHRDGQVSPWVIMTAGGTVEEAVARTMVNRFAASDGIAGADTTALRRVAKMLGVDWLPLEAMDATGER